jgi:hypothetical protein
MSRNAKLLDLLVDDRNVIIYRKTLNKITGGIIGTLILHQALFWHDTKKGAPFYKFKEPCEHEEYVIGDSWCEQLGISAKEFDTAIKKISYKKHKQKFVPSGEDSLPIILYWQTIDRKTYYTINREYLELCLNILFNNDENLGSVREQCKCEIGIFETDQKGFSKTTFCQL